MTAMRTKLAKQTAGEHEYRVQRMLVLASVVTAVLTLGWAGYFASQRQWLIVAFDIVAVAASSASLLLARSHRHRAALCMIHATVFLAIFMSAAFLDMPSPALPRGMHEFFLAQAVAACLTLRTAPAWLRRGFPLSCLAAYAFFAGVNPVWTTAYAVSEQVRSVGVWVDHAIALLVLYLAVQVIQSNASGRNALEIELRDALLRDEFELHFQPQVDIAGRTVAAEALIRWQHPRRGLVPPNAFIPAAEESGLMVPIGDWVLRTACARLAEWANDPALSHLQLAVNVSASQFAEPNFERRVLEIVHAARVPPSKLKLELTESMLAHDLEEVSGKMSALKTAGIAFSLDDFGTGFSSLAYLRRLPFDQLKIDQAFVRNMQASAKDAAIIKAVLALGESLGLEVIAEGVETSAHRRLLQEAGCGLFQGYLYSRPAPAAAFVTDVRRGIARSIVVTTRVEEFA